MSELHISICDITLSINAKYLSDFYYFPPSPSNREQDSAYIFRLTYSLKVSINYSVDNWFIYFLLYITRVYVARVDFLNFSKTYIETEPFDLKESVYANLLSKTTEESKVL